MKISIVTPTYNSENYIQETIDSIHSQSYKNFEHLVIDGLSKDNTVDIIKRANNITLVSEKDNGQSDALNKGFKLASGDLLAWQNADDLYLPGAFETVIRFFQMNPQVDVVYGYYQLIDSKSKWICDVYTPGWNTWAFSHGRFCPPQPTVFWRRRVHQKVGQLNEKLHYCMDVDFYSRAVNNNFKFARIPEMLGQFRVHTESKTQNEENEKKVAAEYKHVLAENFKYTKTDSFFFELFKFRASITKSLKMKWFKRF